MAACNVCSKRVLSHSHFLLCNSCNSKVHLKCMYNVSKNDSIFVNKEHNSWYCTRCIETVFPFYHIYEDTEFMEALSENWITDNPIPFETIFNQDKIFSPFDLNENTNSPLEDIDPDVQFYQNQCNNILHSCDYIIEDSFNKKNIYNYRQ